VLHTGSVGWDGVLLRWSITVLSETGGADKRAVLPPVIACPPAIAGVRRQHGRPAQSSALAQRARGVAFRCGRSVPLLMRTSAWVYMHRQVHMEWANMPKEMQVKCARRRIHLLAWGRGKGRLLRGVWWGAARAGSQSIGCMLRNILSHGRLCQLHVSALM
jgi:hypothetical protein